MAYLLLRFFLVVRNKGKVKVKLMIRIAITSDLHLGITDWGTLRDLAEIIANESPDLLILAGDIGEGVTRFSSCLNIFKNLSCPIAVLAGNHDVWSREGKHSQDLWDTLLPSIVRETNYIWLEDSIWQQEGVAVVGSIAWYDYSAVDPVFFGLEANLFATRKRFYNNDARYIDWAWSDQEFAKIVGDRLITRIQQLQDDPEIDTILVITHLPVCETQMKRKPHEPQWGFSNAYFGNMTLGQRILAFSKVKVVISGHTHIAREGLESHSLVCNEQVLTYVLGSDYNQPTYRMIRIDSTDPNLKKE
jgi:3',5'-cyclic AMP phosphodiesterase CpdA